MDEINQTSLNNQKFVLTMNYMLFNHLKLFKL
jgi:hypothetical protein